MDQTSHSLEDHAPRYEKSPRRALGLRRRIALMGAVMAAMVGGLGLVPIAAQAAGTTLLTGTAVAGNARWANASIGVYQVVNGQWHWDGYFTRANSAGNYSLRLASGNEYEIVGFQQYGTCSIGYFENLWGYSAPFRASTASANAQVTLRPASTQVYFC